MKVRYIASCSFGKDSLAMVLLLIQKKYPLDEVVFFDTGMEFEPIYKNEKKLEKILQKNGIKYTRLKGEKSFEYLAFKHEYVKRDGTRKVGYDWCGGVRRWGTLEKKKALKKYYQKYNNCLIVEYVGIASDERTRIEQVRTNRADRGCIKLYPLIEWGMNEKDCLKWCFEHKISWKTNSIELYDILDRVSCWCCGTKNNKEISNIIKYLPDVWDKIKRYEKNCGVLYKQKGCEYYEAKFKNN